MRPPIPALLACLASLGVASSAPAEDKITFADHVAQVFRNRCGSCHNPDKAKGGLSLETYSGAMQGGARARSSSPATPTPA
jgi:mono/diheme cytochrome c family protein